MSILDEDYEEIDMNESADQQRIHLVRSPRPPRRPFKLAEELYFKQQLTENRIRFMRGLKEHKEMLECTFSPKTNNTQKPRSIKSFLRDQAAYSVHKQHRLLSARLRASQAKAKAKCEASTVSPGSARIVSQAESKSPAHERLFMDSKLSKIPKPLDDTHCTFSPSISKKSSPKLKKSP